jgi:hypothetical protein
LHLIQNKDLRKLLRIFRACAGFSTASQAGTSGTDEAFSERRELRQHGRRISWLIIALRTEQD